MFAIIQQAGWPIWPLLGVSIFALAFILEKSWTLRHKHIAPPRLVEELFAKIHNKIQLAKICSWLQQHSALGRILAAGLAGMKQGQQHAYENMQISAKVVMQDLERYLNGLATIASIAPLLGLLGTVVGMIEIFALQNENAAHPAALAQGISIALYNTAFGLIIAIPALVFWRIFRRRIDELLLHLEIESNAFIKKIQNIKLET